jgi:CRP-like cAMP-binding protein
VVGDAFGVQHDGSSHRSSYGSVISEKEVDMDGKERRIASLELFQGLRAKDVEWIATVADTVDLPAGSLLALRDRAVREFVIVLSGTVGSPEGSHLTLTEGGCFGHDGLVDREPHLHTLEAETPVHLLVFEARAFQGLIDRCPGVARKLMRELAVELRSADRRFVRRASAPALGVAS